MSKQVPQENIPSQKEENIKLGNHIQFALDIEQNFKLYSWRIIDKDTYIARNEDLIRFHKSQTK